jgi:hypothetical protein
MNYKFLDMDWIFFKSHKNFLRILGLYSYFLQQRSHTVHKNLPKNLNSLVVINSSYLITCNLFNDDASTWYIVMESKV